jgi:catechol 2,3-dioxygenase-like lactoylglutathione lyase family enzyme
MTQIQGFHHLSLSVRDLGRSTEWYQQVLGFQITDNVEGAGFRRTRMRSPAGVVLTLTCHEDQASTTFNERQIGMDHVGFRVGAIDDVRVLEEHFEQLGVDRSELKLTPRATASITIRDPDNIQLEVFGGLSGP